MVRLLRELKSQRGLWVSCPKCTEEFRAVDAEFFDATKPLPAAAQEILQGHTMALAADREELRDRRDSAKTRPRIAAQSVNIGKVVEKIAPSLHGFPVEPADCRALLEPIDYIVFHGVRARSRVEAVTFVDIKSGNAKLTERQRTIKGLVEDGRCRFVVTNGGKEE